MTELYYRGDINILTAR